MSQDQSLSTEDLAGRRVPTDSAATAAPTSAGSADPGPPPVSDPAGDDRWIERSEHDRAAHVADDSDPEARLTDAPESEGRISDDGQRRPEDEHVSLVDSAQAEQFRARWGDVQAQFVDDPKAAVGAADVLVAEAMQSLASAFAEHKSRLETQWHGGGDVDTEELRLALRRYRSFFHRLLET